MGIPSVLNEDARGLLESSAQILVSINSNPEDFTNRKIDTRTKKRPTGEDIENIDKMIGELMKQNVINPLENPFSYLLLENCVIYSIVVAFLLLKCWENTEVIASMWSSEKRAEMENSLRGEGA